MSQEPILITHVQRKETLGDQVRRVADQLKQDTGLQIKATSRILGAAAQIAENHDRLIHEVVDMVEGDLDQQTQVYDSDTYTADTLKQQFATLREAKAHYGLRASSWEALVNKLNSLSAQKLTHTGYFRTSVPERLDAIESELKLIRAEISQILSFLQQVLHKR